MRQAVEMVLREDCAVTAVASGNEALPTAKAMHPDIVIADLSLEDKDGYQICQELKADGQLAGVPVLLLYGPSVTYDEAKAQAVQASDALAKPFATQELIDKVLTLSN
jgi:CheY-like chemotaxis protein